MRAAARGAEKKIVGLDQVHHRREELKQELVHDLQQQARSFSEQIGPKLQAKFGDKGKAAGSSEPSSTESLPGGGTAAVAIAASTASPSASPALVPASPALVPAVAPAAVAAAASSAPASSGPKLNPNAKAFNPNAKVFVPGGSGAGAAAAPAATAPPPALATTAPELTGAPVTPETQPQGMNAMRRSTLHAPGAPCVSGKLASGHG